MANFDFARYLSSLDRKVAQRKRQIAKATRIAALDSVAEVLKQGAEELSARSAWDRVIGRVNGDNEPEPKPESCPDHPDGDCPPECDRYKPKPMPDATAALWARVISRVDSLV